MQSDRNAVMEGPSSKPGVWQLCWCGLMVLTAVGAAACQTEGEPGSWEHRNGAGDSGHKFDSGQMVDSGPDVSRIDNGDDVYRAMCGEPLEGPRSRTEQECGMALSGTREQIEKTPRSESPLSGSAELLAVESTDATIARECLYERILQDLQQIDSRSSQVEVYDGLPRHRGRVMVLYVTKETAEQIQAGNHGGTWRCLNEYYEKESHEVQLHRPDDPDKASVLLRFEGIYDMKAMSRHYAQLSGTTTVNGNVVRLKPTEGGLSNLEGPNFEGNDICLEIEDGIPTYVLAGKGSNVRFAHRFRSHGPGDIEQTHEWFVDFEETASAERTPPEWYDDTCGPSMFGR